jgi:hypothetical protein
MPWQVVKINDWADLSEKINETKVHEARIPQWIFRGQADSSWTLIPSLLRKFKMHNISSDIALGIQRQLIREFLTKYKLFCSHDIPQFEGSYDFNVLAMMQHYSCPTRLLDWTNSPFVALYFAVESSFDVDGALYIFHESLVDKIVREKFNKLSDLPTDHILGNLHINSIYAAWTTFQTERNIFQQGLFTVSPNMMVDHEVLIDEILTQANQKGHHFKLIIPKELKIEFLARLKSMNISADILYRSLDGLGKSLAHLVDFRGWRNY